MGWHWAHMGSPIPLGVDFRGGTEVTVQFRSAPDIGAIRSAMDSAGYRDAKIQPIQGEGEANQALIRPAGAHQRKQPGYRPPGGDQRAEQHYSANPFDPNKDVRLYRLWARRWANKAHVRDWDVIESPIAGPAESTSRC